MLQRMSRIATAITAGAIALLTLAACSSATGPAASNNSAAGPATSQGSAATASGDSTGPVTVTFWHESSGPAAAAINSLVAEFNKENAGKITVQASYQGSYADAQTKYTAAVQSHSTPSILAMNDVSTGFMVDSQQTVPMYEFTSKDPTFNLDDIPAAVQKYYGATNGNGLLSMPYAVSQPMLYMNTDLVKQAGLDPTDPPKTLDEVASWAQQIKDKTGKYGLSMNMVDSWILEELTASGGNDFCTPDNGRSADRVTGITMTSPTQIAFLTKLAGLFQDGTALNPGTNSANMTAAFTSGKVGLLLTSSASYTALKPTAQSPVLVAAFPTTSDSKDAGAAIGGASLWISGPGHSQAEQQAAYQFAKFMESAQTQATWSKATGYLSSNTASKSLPDGKAALADPNVATMYEQLANDPASVAASGCRMGPYAAVRATVISYFNKLIAGSDAATLMEQAEQEAQKEISQYNAAVK